MIKHMSRLRFGCGSHKTVGVLPISIGRLRVPPTIMNFRRRTSPPALLAGHAQWCQGNGDAGGIARARTRRSTTRGLSISVKAINLARGSWISIQIRKSTLFDRGTEPGTRVFESGRFSYISPRSLVLSCRQICLREQVLFMAHVANEAALLTWAAASGTFTLMPQRNGNTRLTASRWKRSASWM